MNHSEMMAKIERGDGFIAALDQSGGSTPKALKGYGVEEGAWASDEEMFDLIHQMRSRIITAPCFGSGKVIGAILFERTMDGHVDGKPTPQALIDQGVVPFIKIDKGLEAEANGVQMMKPMPELDRPARARQAARRVRHQGALGHQPRQPRRHRRGRRAAVRRRAPGARPRHGADHRARGEHQEPGARRRATASCSTRSSRNARRHSGRAASHAEAVDSRARPGLFQPLIDHPKVLRVVALSGGFSREEACRELAKNPGMIASFSRALLSDLRHHHSDEEFNATLGSAIDEIYSASTSKVLA